MNFYIKRQDGKYYYDGKWGTEKLTFPMWDIFKNHLDREVTYITEVETAYIYDSKDKRHPITDAAMNRWIFKNGMTRRTEASMISEKFDNYLNRNPDCAAIVLTSHTLAYRVGEFFDSLPPYTVAPEGIILLEDESTALQFAMMISSHKYFNIDIVATVESYAKSLGRL
ncbi:hypothetical protein FDI40_gp648 [Agrobacterium phage Atu_ph07]|uniref:Uncharacterized protein n=1 Tax=Agrobacterium phage Atu_ph07 TaxID=2024264 RepID=A0A2L0V0U4_9CAUD|nr:hypothetical protein FDI40_gp648 [Agrobacterium phage Atu_ph07]AUZ95407.1 hypothetical protein [Agrobacterium phage Atu_ph07]